MHVLDRVDQHRLELRSTGKTRIIASLLMAFGLVVTAGSPLMGGVLLLGGGLAWLGPSRSLFDRRQGKLHLRRMLMFRTFPLEQIREVEVLAGQWHDDSDGPSYQSWELALALDSAYAPRLYLTNHGDQELTRRMAREIAGFLGVPVRDETATAPRPAHAKPAGRKKKKRRR
jgi:hypothetical protein